jgi:uncharacterized protein (TIGR00369 family)
MTEEQNNRSRTFTWGNPSETVKAAMSMSGLEFFQALIAGKVPQPAISETLNFYITEAENGRVVFMADLAEYHYNPMGSVHGGVSATLLDSAMACAVQSTLPAGVGSTTIELKINYVRVMTEATGRVRAIGQLIHAGRRLATAEGRLVDDDDKLYAHGTTTCLILQP